MEEALHTGLCASHAGLSGALSGDASRMQARRQKCPAKRLWRGHIQNVGWLGKCWALHAATAQRRPCKAKAD
jgi:hypothetical protein